MLKSSAQASPFYSLFPHSNQSGLRPGRSVDVARKFAQGAGSALLVFAGADSIASSAAASAAGAPPIADFSSLEGLMTTMLSGQLSGPIQIIVAILVFLAAGQCIARFFGLIAAATVIVLYLQGVTVEDVSVFVQHFGERIAAASSAFLDAEVTG
jgi:hypothetical protein